MSETTKHRNMHKAEMVAVTISNAFQNVFVCNIKTKQLKRTTANDADEM